MIYTLHLRKLRQRARLLQIGTYLTYLMISIIFQILVDTVQTHVMTYEYEKIST